MGDPLHVCRAECELLWDWDLPECWMCLGNPPGMQQELLCSLELSQPCSLSLSAFQVTLTASSGFFSLAVPRLDPQGLRQEPLPGPGGAAGLAGPAAAGEQGSLRAPLPRSHLPSSVQRRCLRCWQQMDEQINSRLLPGRPWPWGLENSVFPLLSTSRDSWLGQESTGTSVGSQGLEQGDSTHRAPCQLPAPVKGWQRPALSHSPIPNGLQLLFHPQSSGQAHPSLLMTISGLAGHGEIQNGMRWREATLSPASLRKEG